MKGWAVLIVIFVAVAMATMLHAYKSKSPQPIDKLSIALKGAEAHLSKGSRISFHNEPLQHELLAQVRYALAPVYVDVNTPAKYDTILSIASLSDNSQQAYFSGRHIFWQHSDDTYTYRLSSAK